MPTSSNLENTDCGHETYRMLIKESTEFCDLLFRKYDPDNKLHINSSSAYGCDAKKVNNYLDPSISFKDDKTPLSKLKTFFCTLFGCHIQAKETLVGYIVKPYEPTAPRDRTNINLKYLMFFPVWLLEDSSGYQEVLEEGIIFEYSYISKYKNVDYPCDGHLVAEAVSPIKSEFDHNTFQYYTEGTFNKAFISRHDLFLITNYSEYVGIVGAKISTGNYITHKFEEDSPNKMTECNEDYFTYRFIGLCKEECSDSSLDVDEIVLVAANSKIEEERCGQESTMDNNINERGEGNDPESSTPTGAHSNPCPPSWRPQP